MADPFLGEIIMFGGNFAPRGWALCDGQLLPIAQYSALFSLLGTTYGGDGRTTFGLPELRGRFPMHPGSGPGLTPRRLGEKSGAENHTLTTPQLPSHSHPQQGSTSEGDQTSPTGNVVAVSDDRNYGDTVNAAMGATGNTGGNQAVNHMPPFLGVNFIIALQGVYPSMS